MQKSIFHISQMDCPSEENLIRMKLDGMSGIRNLEFDLEKRELTVYHDQEISPIQQAIEGLKLGGKLLSTEKTEARDFQKETRQRKLLWTVLAINFGFFLIEVVFGIISKSMGLLADSLDMLADSFVYGISLYAVGSTLVRKKKIAKIAGYFQIFLAVFGFLEVLRRFFLVDQIPNFNTMIVISFLSFLANGYCLYLLQKSKSKEEVHMKASMIFTSNDVIINLGVIVAGLLVHWLDSNKPDLVIGTIVFVLVIQGARRILKLGE
ncbi:MAG: cation transporter [Algoriphagus sp.]|uniref:cation transporter n=1 Tax=Algoriphagus sp. TaxID=1872435 RepID=UPI0017AF6DB4|nr:cation transporter [Algoriphagus sp.]NVJ87713.1 cation transporter [Algoriphagus sp.]